MRPIHGKTGYKLFFQNADMEFRVCLMQGCKDATRQNTVTIWRVSFYFQFMQYYENVMKIQFKVQKRNGCNHTDLIISIHHYCLPHFQNPRTQLNF